MLEDADLDGTPGGNLTVTKVKAHRSKKVMEALPPPEKLRADLNVKADLGAKAAAAEQLPDQYRVQLAKEKLHRAKRALEYVAHFRVSLAEEGS